MRGCPPPSTTSARCRARPTGSATTSPSCRQYRENLFDAVAPLGEGVEGAPVLDKLRLYFNHPGFVEPAVDATLAALAELPDEVRDGAHLAFVTHSIPLSMNDASGPPEQGGGAYVTQHLDVAATVVARVAEETGVEHPHAGRPGGHRRRRTGSPGTAGRRSTTSRRWSRSTPRG